MDHQQPYLTLVVVVVVGIVNRVVERIETVGINEGCNRYCCCLDRCGLY